MSRVSVAILFYIFIVATLSAAQAPAESPKAFKATTPAKAPEAAKKVAPAMAPEAATIAPSSRKSGPAASPATTSSPPSSTDEEASSPPPPSTSVASPTTEGPVEGPADADQSDAATPKSDVAMASIAAAVAIMVFY
ncbi:unnamed protein product [Urochloa humidicola]